MQFRDGSAGWNTLAHLLTQLHRDRDSMRRLHRVAEVAGGLSVHAAQDLVADVIAEMISGALAHDATLALEEQLSRYVERRAKRVRRGLRRTPHVPLDAVAEDELPAAGGAPDDDGYPCAADLPEVLAHVRRELDDKPDALRLLALRERGVLSRRAARHAGMSLATYDRAQRQVLSAAARVQEARREAALAASAKPAPSTAPATTDPAAPGGEALTGALAVGATVRGEVVVQSLDGERC